MREALLQPFVPGEPMSVSFLVLGRYEEFGKNVVLMISDSYQRVERRGDRFAYVGGVVPGGAKDVSPARRAVEAIEGLRGWVGVDFLWDESRGRATILEINPRVTTSYIGLRRLVPKRGLARSILACRDPTVMPHPCAHRGFMIHHRPLAFDAGGKVSRAGENSHGK